jgi:hypothetical protein
MPEFSRGQLHLILVPQIDAPWTWRQWEERCSTQTRMQIGIIEVKIRKT